MSRYRQQALDASRWPRSTARPFAFALLLASGALACTTLACAQAPAGAEPHGFALNWVRSAGAEGCISSSQLAARIDQLLGPVFRAPDGADRAIEGLIEPGADGGGFQVRLRMVDRAGAVLGERSFASDATDCSTLSEPILLVLALMIDPSASERGLPAELLGLLRDGAAPGAELLAELQCERAARERSASAAAVRSQPPAAEAKPRPRPASEPAAGTAPGAGERARPRPSPFGLELALAPGLSYRVQPDVEAGIGLRARLLTPWPVAFELGAAYALPSTLDLSAPSGRGTVDFHAALVTLAACLPIAQLARLGVGACAGAVLVARWRASDVLAGGSEPTRAFFGPVATLDLRYAFAPRWFAQASASVLAMLPRDSFFYTDRMARKQALYEPSAVGLWTALGVGVRI